MKFKNRKITLNRIFSLLPPPPPPPLFSLSLSHTHTHKGIWNLEKHNWCKLIMDQNYRTNKFIDSIRYRLKMYSFVSSFFFFLDFNCHFYCFIFYHSIFFPIFDFLFLIFFFKLIICFFCAFKLLKYAHIQFTDRSCHIIY